MRIGSCAIRNHRCDVKAIVQPGDPPSLFVAIEEQLDLRLQRTRGGVDVLVIERLEPLAKE
jgi:uncharacterized protein (TIGR03435 family)